MRKRLRPAYTPDQLATVYPTPHDHTRFPDHLVRVHQTIALARWFTDRHHVATIADLSCGDAAIADGVNSDGYGGSADMVLHLGDFAPGYAHEGPIETTIHEIPDVDLFILSETLEHLDDPDAVLTQIRAKAKFLVLTTPDSEWDDSNPEHYWGWDTGCVEKMLQSAGWRPEVSSVLRFRPYGGVYDFQMWGCS